MLATQSSKKVGQRVVTFVFGICIAIISLRYQLVKWAANWKQCVVSVMGPYVFMRL